MVCGSTLMTGAQCREFVAGYEWKQLPLEEDANPQLTVGYLRNNGVTARLTKTAPISMFRLDSRTGGVLVAAEQLETAGELLSQLSSRFSRCLKCGHVVFEDESECSFCEEPPGETR